MTEREQNHETSAHTMVEKKGKSSRRKFFINWKNIKKKNVTLTSQLLAKKKTEKPTAKIAFCETKPH